MLLIPVAVALHQVLEELQRVLKLSRVYLLEVRTSSTIVGIIALIFVNLCNLGYLQYARTSIQGSLIFNCTLSEVYYLAFDFLLWGLLRGEEHFVIMNDEGFPPYFILLEG